MYVGFLVFGLGKVGVVFEGLKVYFKVFVVCYKLLVVVCGVFIDVVEVYVYVDVVGCLFVIKVDGLCVGKGVVVLLMIEEVYEVIDVMLV